MKPLWIPSCRRVRAVRLCYRTSPENLTRKQRLRRKRLQLRRGFAAMFKNGSKIMMPSPGFLKDVKAVSVPKHPIYLD